MVETTPCIRLYDWRTRPSFDSLGKLLTSRQLTLARRSGATIGGLCNVTGDRRDGKVRRWTKSVAASTIRNVESRAEPLSSTPLAKLYLASTDAASLA
jgi:hypothetical protein